MFWKKKPIVPPLSVSDFLALDIRLRDIIALWVKKEIGTGMRPNTKLTEVGIFNFKILYSDTPESKEMRDFIQRSSNIEGATEYTFSRIQDLYIDIVMSFPKSFIDGIKNKHINVLRSLGYNVDDNIVESFEFGWLLARIQSTIRYSTTMNTTPFKSNLSKIV